MKTDIWAMAYVKQAIPLHPSLPQSPTWLTAPKGRYYADPFLIEHRGTPWVFFEDFNLSSKLGHIAASPLEPFQARPALVRPWHLSYPFMLRQEGKLYCLPEQHESGRVSLYRCHSFPDRWEEESVLLPNFAGVDPTLLHCDSRWWLWVGEQSKRARDNTFLFSAPSLNGPWQEHPQSPAISRPNLARPAGPILRQAGRLIRPVQNRSKTYGGGLAFFEICILSQESYLEKEIQRLEPEALWPFADGLHHLSRLGDITIWDAKRIEDS